MLGTVRNKVAYVFLDFDSEAEMSKCFDGRTFFGDFRFVVEDGHQAMAYTNDGLQAQNSPELVFPPDTLLVERGTQEKGFLVEFRSDPGADVPWMTVHSWDLLTNQFMIP